MLMGTTKHMSDDLHSADLSATAKHRRSDLMRRHDNVIDDLMAGMKLHHLWRALAWEDLIQRYRSSTLGIVWIAVSFWAMVAIFVILFGRTSPNLTQFGYMIYLATGLCAWNFIQAGVTKGSAVFAGNGGWIRSTPAPLSILVYRSVLAVIYEVLIIFVLVVPLALYFHIPDLVGVGIILIGVILFVLNLVFLSLFLGAIGAWSADFQQILLAVMRIAFFATPIFWEFEPSVGLRRAMGLYNPFTHFVALIREPLMGHTPTAINWAVVGVATLFVLVAGTITFKYSRKRLAAWV